MFGRDAGDGRGDDHVTRASEAIAATETTADTTSRGSGEKPTSGAGGSGREPEHEKAAGSKPKTPDVDLGV